ncbi:MAG: peptide chain release factor N(5)-glutamine methyltransferase [Bifidobacterium mongoliense]|nr:peptide chain release factor N(5)-glutamine methyltransferase [Bifidobacterium mongoliense]
MTLRETIRTAAQELSRAGVDTPDHDARALVAAAYGLSLSGLDRLLILREEPASHPGAESMLRELLRRRCSREPLQYMLGRAPFRFLDLRVGPGVFIPRPETETVVQVGIDWLRALPHPPIVVDLCAGSGAIGLAVVTEITGSRVWAVEASEDALLWTRRNRDEVAQSLPDIADRYHLIQGDATSADTLGELDGSVDAVITNPPYVPQSQPPVQPEVRDHDPEMALYGGSPDGLRIPEAIVDRSATLLKSGGLLVMEHDSGQARPLVDAARARGFSDARTLEDLTGRPRMLRAVKGPDGV